MFRPKCDNEDRLPWDANHLGLVTDYGAVKA
jgi:hypothetical protein